MVYNLLACGYPYLANTWANILDVYSVLHYMLYVTFCSYGHGIVLPTVLESRFATSYTYPYTVNVAQKEVNFLMKNYS